MNRQSRKRSAAIAAAVAVALAGGALTYVSAVGGGATATSFVPIAPCRLLDTRSGAPVGPRSTPINAGESLNVQVTGSNGQCVIPSNATAIVINVTALQPTAQGYLTLYPSHVVLPNASNLNFVAGQKPTPNLVTVSLSPGGAIKIFNANGTVNVLGDIAGYYQPDTGAGNDGAPCKVGNLNGVVVTGVDYENNLSTKCFTSLVTTLAGSVNGTVSGQAGNNAEFGLPVGVAVDGNGNVYVVDLSNNQIRKVSVTGFVTLFAGDPAGSPGFADGLGSAARFKTPVGIAVDAIGNVYVADTGNNAIRMITPNGYVSTVAGTGTSGSLDGNVGIASFNGPQGVAVDGAGAVYVADTGNHSIRKIFEGDVSTFAGSTQGYLDDTGTAAQFNGPIGIAVDSGGNLYVGDGNNRRIRKITPVAVVTTLAGSGLAGSADGVGAAAQFNEPAGVAVDAAGNVYVAESTNNRIRKISPNGTVTTIAGLLPGDDDGVGTAGHFSFPYGVAVDGSGTIFVADELNYRIRKIS